MTLIDDIRDAGGLIETCDVQTIIGYIQRGELTPAGELLSQAAHLQEACMNSLKADVLWKLCDRLGEYVPDPEAGVWEATRGARAPRTSTALQDAAKTTTPKTN